MRTLAFFAMLACGRPSFAVIIDRIAIVIDNRPIKDSDIDREIRVAAFLNGEPLSFSPAERKKAAQRLIDQRIIRRETELGNYGTASDEEVAAFLKSVTQQRFRVATQYNEALRDYGLSDRELRAQLGWQITVLHFIETRFRPAVIVSDAGIDRYAKTHPKESRAQIEEFLVGQEVTDAFDGWLSRARKRIPIEYREEELR